MTVDPSSEVVAATRRVQLGGALALDGVALGLALAAAAGGMLSAVALVFGTVVTGVALTISLHSWAGAREVWSGKADPARLRGFVQRSLWPALPVLLVSLGVIFGMAYALVVRSSSSSPTAGNATWIDGAVFASLLLYLLASVGAVRYALSIRR